MDTTGTKDFVLYHKSSKKTLLISFEELYFDAIVHCFIASGPDVVMVLMGTKLDLVKDTPSARQVAANEAKGMASSKHMIDAIETSSKEDTNIGKTFKKLAKALKQKYEGLKAMDDHEESVHLATQSLNEKQTGCKC